MTKSVPDVPLVTQEVPDHLQIPLDKGRYKAQIVDFQEPRISNSGRYWFLGIKLKLEHQPDRVCYTFMSGHLPAMRMIQSLSKYWMGMVVEVDVRVREYDNRLYNSFDIIWPK